MASRQKAIEHLEELVGRIPSLQKDPRTSTQAFVKWRRDVEVAIEHLFPDKPAYAASFRGISFQTDPYRSATVPGSHERAFANGMEKASGLLHSMIEQVRTFWTEDATLPASKADDMPGTRQHPSSRPAADPRNVFVVHGRNSVARRSMFEFLRAIRLNPLEWSQIVAATGKTTPYIGEVLEKGFSMAQAVVVLFTPDDEARLKQQFQKPNDSEYESRLMGQARPNVLFEAGMAMGLHPNRTVIVDIGNLRPFTDLGGRHVVRLNNTPESRKDLATRLKNAQCAVDVDGDDWMSAGTFDADALNTETVAPSSTVPASTIHAASTQSLTPLEEDIIKSARSGWIYINRNDAYGSFVDNFVSPDDPTYQAKYLDALDSLRTKGLLRSETPDAFRLTGRGHAIHEALQRARDKPPIGPIQQTQTGGASSVNIQGRDISLNLPRPPDSKPT